MNYENSLLGCLVVVV